MIDENRIIDLEVRVSYLEDFLNQIQQVVVEQGEELEALKKENRLLKEKVNELFDSVNVEIPNRKPPHY